MLEFIHCNREIAASAEEKTETDQIDSCLPDDSVDDLEQDSS